MARRGTHTAVAVITTITVLVSVALLTLATAGTPKAQAAGCEGGGGGSPSASASPSPSGGGGGPNPTSILTLLPGGDESPSASPSGSARPSSSGGSASPSNTQTTSEEQDKREVVPLNLQDQSCKSTITISYSNRKKAFGGRVGSEEAMCKRARKVAVKRIKRGKDATVGRSVTNARGTYTVPSRNPNGRFYAVVAKATVENDDGGRTTCQAARSKAIRP